MNKPVARPIAKPVAKAAPVTKVTPKPAVESTEAVASNKKERAKKVFADSIPAFLFSQPDEEGNQPVGTTSEGATEENQGTILLVKDPENPKRGARPVRLQKTDFPRNRDGRIAFWDYKIAIAEYGKSKAMAAGDDAAKKRKKMEKMRDAMKELADELGVDLMELLGKVAK